LITGQPLQNTVPLVLHHALSAMELNAALTCF
jgi:hypothetical protein